MPYIYCAPALITALVHGLDNIVTGEVEIDGTCIPFRTRGHIVKATNKHYRGTNWKPAKGSHVFLDGEHSAGLLTIDHIEGCVTMPPALKPHEVPVEVRVAVERTSGASKVLRTGRYGNVWTFRFATPVTRMSGRDKVQHLVHGKVDCDGWRFWTKTVEGARTGFQGCSEWLADAMLASLNPDFARGQAAAAQPKPAADKSSAITAETWDSVPF